MDKLPHHKLIYRFSNTKLKIQNCATSATSVQYKKDVSQKKICE